jgi:hypothetical protein
MDLGTGRWDFKHPIIPNPSSQLIHGLGFRILEHFKVRVQFTFKICKAPIICKNMREKNT